jgi:L-ascorbate 6-phosphate lactonase
LKCEFHEEKALYALQKKSAFQYMEGYIVSLTIIWLGQAGFVFKSAQGSMAIDPYCGQPPDGSIRLYEPIIPKNWITVDFSVSTHDHWDHFDTATYVDYVLPKAIAGPSSVIKLLKKSPLNGKVESIPFDTGDTFERCGFKVKAAYAVHDRDSIGVLVELDGLKLYFSGDTLFSSMLMMYNNFKPDVMFVCINGKLGNMSYFEAAQYCKLLDTKTAVPMHYDLIQHNTENPESFTKILPVLSPQTKGVIIEKGIEYKIEDIFNGKIG